MALPILATVGKAARAAFPIIEGGVSRGLSATAINNLIRSAQGTGIRRQTLLDIMRELRGIEQKSSALRFMNRNSIVNTSRLAQAATIIRRDYSYTVRIRGFLSNGDPTERFINVSTSDGSLTRGQIEDIAVQVIEENVSEYGMEIEDATIITGVRAGSRGALS